MDFFTRKRSKPLQCSRPGCSRRRTDLRYRQCPECREQARLSKVRRRASLRQVGACVACCEDLEAVTVEEGYDTCPECRDAAQARWKAWEARHPEYKRPFYDGWFPRRRDR